MKAGGVGGMTKGTLGNSEQLRKDPSDKSHFGGSKLS